LIGSNINVGKLTANTDYMYKENHHPILLTTRVMSPFTESSRYHTAELSINGL